MKNLDELIPDLAIEPGAEDQFISYSYNGQDYLLVLTPVGVHDWYFGTILHESIMTGEVSKFANFVAMAIVAVALVFIGLLLYIILAGRRHDRAKKELDEKASRDSMTKLLNKKAFEATVEKTLENAAENKGVERHYLLGMIDIDDFKHVNDTYGHEAGDKVIIETAERLRKVFRDSDVIGRVGGDEFSVFLRCSNTDVQNLEALLRKRADAGLAEMTRPIVIGNEELNVSFSVGFAYSPQHGKDYNTLYKNADKALYSAKMGGKNRYEICQ